LGKVRPTRVNSFQIFDRSLTVERLTKPEDKIRIRELDAMIPTSTCHRPRLLAVRAALSRGVRWQEHSDVQPDQRTERPTDVRLLHVTLPTTPDILFDTNTLSHGYRLGSITAHYGLSVIQFRPSMSPAVSLNARQNLTTFRISRTPGHAGESARKFTTTVTVGGPRQLETPCSAERTKRRISGSPSAKSQLDKWDLASLELRTGHDVQNQFQSEGSSPENKMDEDGTRISTFGSPHESGVNSGGKTGGERSNLETDTQENCARILIRDEMRLKSATKSTCFHCQRKIPNLTFSFSLPSNLYRLHIKEDGLVHLSEKDPVRTRGIGTIATCTRRRSSTNETGQTSSWPKSTDVVQSRRWRPLHQQTTFDASGSYLRALRALKSSELKGRAAFPLSDGGCKSDVRLKIRRTA
ncbi:unnamed protein product, partial [Nesidiocoris tenuis]